MATESAEIITTYQLLIFFRLPEQVSSRMTVNGFTDIILSRRDGFCHKELCH